jgi:hypothetical protein
LPISRHSAAGKAFPAMKQQQRRNDNDDSVDSEVEDDEPDYQLRLNKIQNPHSPRNKESKRRLI